MTDVNDWNKPVISDFRARGGKPGGQFEGAPMPLLYATGAKSGEERVNPVMYQQVADDVAVFASEAGAPTNPDWFHKIKANGRASVEIATETYDVRARVAEGDERQRIWETQKERYPGFAGYEEKTDREIPVLVLERAS